MFLGGCEERKAEKNQLLSYGAMRAGKAFLKVVPEFSARPRPKAGAPAGLAFALSIAYTSPRQRGAFPAPTDYCLLERVELGKRVFERVAGGSQRTGGSW